MVDPAPPSLVAVFILAVAALCGGLYIRGASAQIPERPAEITIFVTTLEDGRRLECAVMDYRFQTDMDCNWEPFNEAGPSAQSEGR